MLGSYEGFDLVLWANRTEHVGVRVKVIAEHIPLIQLNFEFALDQTYLPAIIRQLDAEFPPPYRVAV